MKFKLPSLKPILNSKVVSKILRFHKEWWCHFDVTLNDFANPTWSILSTFAIFLFTKAYLDVPNTCCDDSVALMGCWAWTKEYFIPIYAASLAILAFAIPLCNNVFSKLKGDEFGAYASELVRLVYQFLHMRTVIVLNVMFLALGGAWILISGSSLLEEVKTPLFGVQLFLLLLWLLIVFHFSILSWRMFQLFKDSLGYIRSWIKPYISSPDIQYQHSKIYFRLHREELVRRVQLSYSVKDYEEDIDKYVNDFASPFIKQVNKGKTPTDSKFDLCNLTWEALESAAERILESSSQKARFYRDTVMSFYRLYFINIKYLNEENRRNIIETLYKLANTILKDESIQNRESFLSATFMTIEHILGRPVLRNSEMEGFDETNSGKQFIEEFNKNIFMYLRSIQRSAKLLIDAARQNSTLVPLCRDHLLVLCSKFDDACEHYNLPRKSINDEANFWFNSLFSTKKLIELNVNEAKYVCSLSLKNTFEDYLLFLDVYLRENNHLNLAQELENWQVDDPTLDVRNTDKLLQRPERIIATVFRLLVLSGTDLRHSPSDWFNNVKLEPKWNASIPSRGSLAYWVQDINAHYNHVVEILNQATRYKSFSRSWLETLTTAKEVHEISNYSRIYSFLEYLSKHGNERVKSIADDMLERMKNIQDNALKEAPIDVSIIQTLTDWFWQGFKHPDVLKIMFSISREARKRYATVFTFKLGKFNKSSLLPDNHPLKVPVIGEDEFYKSLGENAMYSILSRYVLSPIYKKGTKLHTPDADIFWAVFKQKIESLRMKNLTPIVICGNITAPAWWYDWIDEYGGLNRFRKPKDFTVEELEHQDTYSATYYWKINGVLTISLPTIAQGEFLIFPKEALEEFEYVKPNAKELVPTESLKLTPHDITLQFKIPYRIKLKEEFLTEDMVSLITTPVEDI